MAEVERILETLLAGATEAGSRNTTSVSEVRDWLRELVADYADELSTGREDLVAQTMWDILTTDADPGRDALFIAAVFLGGEVRFVAGRGSVSDVRAFGESEFPSETALLLEELVRRFPVTTTPQISIARGDVMDWLSE